MKSLSTKKSLDKYTKNKEIILSENFEKDMNDWKLPEISKSKVYKKGSFELKSEAQQQQNMDNFDPNTEFADDPSAYDIHYYHDAIFLQKGTREEKNILISILDN